MCLCVCVCVCVCIVLIICLKQLAYSHATHVQKPMYKHIHIYKHTHKAVPHPLHHQQEQPPPTLPDTEPKKPSTKLGRLPSLPPSLASLRDRSKLTRSLTRLVQGLSVTDLHQQVCDAGAMEMVIALVRGDEVTRQLAADLLLDVAAHQGRVHHLSKRGAVQVRGNKGGQGWGAELSDWYWFCDNVFMCLPSCVDGVCGTMRLWFVECFVGIVQK